MKFISGNTLVIDKFIPKLITENKIVSFVLYGNKDLYVDGAIRNIKDVRDMYGSDWSIHIGFGDDVREDITSRLIPLIDSYSFFKTDGHKGSLQRFNVDCDILLSRDIDAKISHREINVISDWLNTIYDYCIMRDHPGQKSAIPCGLFSIRGNDNIRHVRSLSQEFIPKSRGYYGEDELFLGNVIYPIVKDRCIEYSSQVKLYDFKVRERLDVRKDIRDVIGDGISKYHGAPMNNENKKIVTDDIDYLRSKSLKWTNRINPKAWVSFGSIDDEYHDFYEPVSYMWNKFGYKTFYTFICNENSIEENEYGIILRLKNSEVSQTFDPTFGRNYVWQSQISRLYASSFIDGIMLISDSDSMPLQNKYYDSLISLVDKETICISRKKPYYNNDKYCMMWVAAKSEVFTKAFNSNTTFDEYCKSYYNKYKVTFVTDEQMLTDDINNSGCILKFMDYIPVVRIDKINWGYNKISLADGHYTDSHLLRPYKKYDKEIAQLMYDRFPTDSGMNKFKPIGHKFNLFDEWGPKDVFELQTIMDKAIKTDRYSYQCGTHIGMLHDIITVLELKDKLVYEFGGGYWSTSILLNGGVKLNTIEQGQNVPMEVNNAWADKLRTIYKDHINWNYEVRPGVTSWSEKEYDIPSFVFVDGSSMSRSPIVQHFINSGVKTIAAHDTEHNGYKWSTIDPKCYTRIDYVKETCNMSTVWTTDMKLIEHCKTSINYKIIPEIINRHYNPPK